MSLAENGSRIGVPPSLGTSERGVMESLARNPDFARNPIIVIEGLNEAFVIYNDFLLSVGFTFEDAQKAIVRSKENLNSRKKAIRFIQAINAISLNKKDENGNGHNHE